jgi:hypothetical protein
VSSPTLDTNGNVVALTLDTTDVVVKSLLSTLIPVTNEPVDVDTLATTLVVVVDTPVTALAVVKFLLSTLIPVTKVPVDDETDPTTLVVEAATSVTAVPVLNDTLWLCPAYDTTLPSVAVEYVNGSPGLTAPSDVACATPATITLTLPPALAESIAIPTMFGYVEDDG